MVINTGPYYVSVESGSFVISEILLEREEVEMAYIITAECVACGACKPECPVEAIAEGDPIYTIDPEKCTDCGACANVCPSDACKPKA